LHKAESRRRSAPPISRSARLPPREGLEERSIINEKRFENKVLGAIDTGG